MVCGIMGGQGRGGGNSGSRKELEEKEVTKKKEASDPKGRAFHPKLFCSEQTHAPRELLGLVQSSLTTAQKGRGMADSALLPCHPMEITDESLPIPETAKPL